MKTDCPAQFSLDFHPDKDLRGRFDGGHLTSDAGLLTLRQHESNRSFYERISGCLNDPRQPGKVKHLQPEVLRQRGLGIVAGYEDAVDSDRLRSDPAFIVMNNRSDLQADRGPSQSTVSRMENSINPRSVVRLNRWLCEDWLDRLEDPPDQVILEIDATDDPTHGAQQLSMYDGFYDQYMYFPLLIFDGETGDCLCARLRRGGACAKERSIPHLRRIIHRIREVFPKIAIRIKLRADAGFMDPALYRMLEEENVEYAINLSKNDVLKRKTNELLEEVKEAYQVSEEPETLTRFTEFVYQAGSWKKPRRVCAKVQHGPKGTNRRFVVTNQEDLSAGETFAFYEARGQSENFIKELKNGFFADRLSCTSFVANAFRLLEHVLAYNLVNDFRNRWLGGTSLATADIHTLRVKLFKVAGRIKTTVRNIWVHLSESWPFRSGFLKVAHALCPRAG